MSAYLESYRARTLWASGCGLRAAAWSARRRSWLAALALSYVLGLNACGGQTERTGVIAWLRLPTGQFVEGALPAPDGGPSVQQASVSRQDIIPGEGDRSLSAFIAPGATGVLLGLQGDSGYWILPSGPPDVQQPDALTVSSDLAFSATLPTGDFTLELVAVDASGRPGTPYDIPLHTDDPALPDAGLAFTLTWDTESDLDLHVVDAAGDEIYWGDISDGPDGGLLDYDSNESCVIDGLRRERVVWQAGAPPGHYVARVDTPSLCGQADAHWVVTAQLGSSVVRTAEGEAIPQDTRGDHGRGAGVTALELDVP